MSGIFHMHACNVDQVKSIRGQLSFPDSRRIAGQQGHFTRADYAAWLKAATLDQLALSLRRLAQLNQTKVYLFWHPRMQS
jgi:hypothetical protein